MGLPGLARLYSDLAQFYAVRTEQADRPGERAPTMLAQVAEELAQVATGTIAAPEPAPLPVTRLLALLDQNLDRNLDQNLAPVLGSFLGLADSLPWTQTRVYLDALPVEFVRNYGYVRLVGPGEGAVVHSDRVAVGIGVWGSGLYYPRHAHPAEEAYHVLAGAVGFRGADGVRRELRPGPRGDMADCAHNAPDEPHELWFGAPGSDPERIQPCVLLWAWVGEISVDARLGG